LNAAFSRIHFTYSLIRRDATSQTSLSIAWAQAEIKSDEMGQGAQHLWAEACCAKPDQVFLFNEAGPLRAVNAICSHALVCEGTNKRWASLLMKQQIRRA